MPGVERRTIDELDTAIAMQQAGAIRVTQGEVWLMQAGDDRGAGAREHAQPLEDAELLRGVEVVGGLIEQVDRRRLDQQARDGRAPLLATRQRGQLAVRE